VGGAQPPPPASPAPPKAVEELIAQLDAIQAQQAQLEKARQETVAVLKERLKQQKQRLQRLGVSEEEAVPTPTNTTGGLGPLVAPRVPN
jgi:hypothetical protein